MIVEDRLILAQRFAEIAFPHFYSIVRDFQRILDFHIGVFEQILKTD
jgi:hypothetical protein